MINKQLVMRYEGNPILTKHDIPYTVETVHNAAATKYEDQYILLFRSHLRNGRSILGIARIRAKVTLQFTRSTVSKTHESVC